MPLVGTRQKFKKNQILGLRIVKIGLNLLPLKFMDKFLQTALVSFRTYINSKHAVLTLTLPTAQIKPLRLCKTIR